jgi:hypothetical protein
MNNEWMALILTQLGKEKPVITPANEVYVLVHPFFPFNSKVYTPLHHRNPAYFDNIWALIREFKGPILTLDNELNATLSEYEKLSPKGARFFLGNNITAEPVCGWNTVAEIINAFMPSETIFGGANLYRFDDGHEKRWEQCVGRTYNNLAFLVPNPRIDFSLSDIIE